MTESPFLTHIEPLTMWTRARSRGKGHQKILMVGEKCQASTMSQVFRQAATGGGRGESLKQHPPPPSNTPAKKNGLNSSVPAVFGRGLGRCEPSQGEGTCRRVYGGVGVRQ